MGQINKCYVCIGNETIDAIGYQLERGKAKIKAVNGVIEMFILQSYFESKFAESEQPTFYIN